MGEPRSAPPHGVIELMSISDVDVPALDKISHTASSKIPVGLLTATLFLSLLVVLTTFNKLRVVHIEDGSFKAIGLCLIATLCAFVYAYGIGSEARTNRKIFLWGMLVVAVGGLASLYAAFGGAPGAIGLPGHTGDFFQLIDLSIKNRYEDVSRIGYLPGVLVMSKLLSLAFPVEHGDVARTSMAYFLYFLIQFSVLYITVRASSQTSGSTNAFLLILFFVSYPFLLNLERGNWVFLSMLFFVLSFVESATFGPVALGAFASLKAFNAAFLPPFFMNEKPKTLKFAISLLFFAGLLPLIIFSLCDSHIAYSDLFKNLTGAGASPDAHIAAAHSGAYAMLVTLQDAGMFVEIDRVAFVQKSIFLLAIALVVVYLVMFYQRFVLKTFDRLDTYFYLLLIFFLTKLLHHQNTDMNFVIVIPILIRLFFENIASLERVIHACSLILMTNLNLFVLYSVRLGAQDGGDGLFSLRTLIYPVVIAFVCALLVFRTLDRILSVKRRVVSVRLRW